MPIDITGVPASTRRSGAFWEINVARPLGLPVVRDKILLVGTQLSTSTATPEELVQVFNAEAAQTLFGAGSPLAIMVEAVLSENPYIFELWCCPLDEAGGGVAATGTIVAAITTVVAGTLTLWVGPYSVSIAITTTDTAATIAAAINTALGELAELPLTSAVNGGTPEQLDLTVKAKGTAGNDWELAYDFTGSGVSLTITQPASGSGDPDITDALTVAHPGEWALIATEYNDATSLAALKSHLDSVSDTLEQRPGTGYAAFVGTVSAATTLGSAVNSGRITIPMLRGTRSHPMQIAAAYAAEVLSVGDRAKPLNGRHLVAVLPPDDPADYLTETEQESLLHNGVTPLQTVGGQDIRIRRWATTYVTNPLGSPSATLLDAMTIRVLDYTRAAVRAFYDENLAGKKLATRALDSETVDPTTIRLGIQGVLLQLQNELGYLQNVEDNFASLVVELDAENPGRVNVDAPAEIVRGLHVLAGRINLL